MANGIVLTNNGQEWIAERIAGVQGAGTNNVASNAGSHVAHGTGTTTPAAADTALQTEVDSRATTTVTVTGTGSSAKYQATSAAITAGGTEAITEAGLLSASSSGTLFIHTVFSALNLVSGDTVVYVFTIDPS